MDTTTVKASEARDEFMMLLITQLKNQDPLDPVKQENFLSQLAQFSSLEQMEKTNKLLEDQAAAQQQATQLQQLSQAATLVGRKVAYEVTAEGAAPETREGTVSSVSIAAGQVKFQVGEDTVSWGQIKEVSQSTPSTGASSGNGNVSGDDEGNENGVEPDEEPIMRRRGAGS